MSQKTNVTTVTLILYHFKAIYNSNNGSDTYNIVTTINRSGKASIATIQLTFNMLSSGGKEQCAGITESPLWELNWNLQNGDWF